MKRLLLATAAMIAVSALPAKADVIINDQGGSTGDLVTFQSQTGNLVVGAFNGQHTGLVDFNCLGGCTNFVGAQSGNDMKITADGLTNMSVQVFDTSLNVLATDKDIFSITGTGDVFVGVTANEPGGGTQLITFDTNALFGPLGPGQNFFTLTAINGETINKFTLLDVGGTITDFEHYRIDVASVPGPIVGAGLPGLIAACCGLFGLNRFRRKRRVA
jgi:hypothetical protein